MKYIFFSAVLLVLAACASLASPITETPAESSLQRTKLFAITAEAETQTNSYPANDATATAIVAGKYAAGTSMTTTLTAQPSQTPVPTIPVDSPFCQLDDLRVEPNMVLPATHGQYLFGAKLTNISKSPCFLQAWPQATLQDLNNHPLDVDYYYFDMAVSDATFASTQQAQESIATKVGLWPGWSTSLDLVWSNWCGTPLPDGVVVRLTLIDNLGIIDIPTNVQAVCDAPGFRSSMGISKLSPAMPPQ